ncbi:TPA: phage tail length tape measure family protein, partial [Yersinia enterocolitica]
MADIATISLRADTSSLEQGDKALDHFGQTAEKATKQADGLNDAFKAGAQSQKQNNESLKQQQQALQDLLAKINPVNNALNKLDDMQLQLSKFRSQGIVDDRTYRESAVAIGRARQELTAAAEASTKAGRAAAEQAAADRAATTAKENFITRLREQTELQGKTASQVQEYKAAQLGMTQQAAPFIARLKEQEDAWKKGAISAGQYRQAMRQLPAQFTDIATSIAGGMPLWLVLTQQGGQISDSFGGLSGMFAAIQNALFGVDESAEQSSESLSENANNLAENAENAKNLVGPLGFVKFGVIGVAAALAVASVAYYKAFQEQEEFNKSVILTGGYSGVTARQLSSMAYEVAKSTGTIGQASTVLSKLAGAGVSSAVDFQNATQAILDFSDASGESIDSLVKQYSQLSDDPAGGSLALTKNMHYLTAAQYENIAALQAQGDKAGAVAVATDALSGAMTRRAQEIKDSMGSLPKFFNDVADAAKKMWDGVMGLGRDPSDAEKRAKLVLKINSADEYQRRSALVGKTASMPADYDEWKRELAAIDAVGVKKTNNAKLDQGAIDAQLGLNKLMQDGLTPAEKRTKAEKELNRWIQENKKAAAEGRATLFTSQDIEKARAGIANQYKDPKTPRTPKEKAYQDDAGTRELLASQQRLAALKDQVSASATLTNQEQQLSKFTQQIADLKSKTILTADQKSLLARSGEITASMQLEAQLSRENAERKKATAALKQMDDYTTTIANRNAQAQAKFGKTSKQAAHVDQEFQLDNTFDKQKEGVTGAALEKLTESYNKA